MSTTALVWIVLYVTALVGTFVNPLLGVLGYLLEYYARPSLHWWGKDLPVLRWNLMISMALAASFLMRRSSLPDLRRLKNLALPWLFSFNAWMLLISATFAVNEVTSFHWTIHWMKMAVVFPLIVVGVLRSRGAFDAFVATNIGGAFWWGWQAWTHPHRRAGRLEEVGSGDSLNDNAASAHLLTVLPFIVVFALTHKNKKLRALALIAAPFVVNTIILCNSRGAMVGLLIAAAVALLLVRRGQRLRMALVAVLTAAAFLMLADPEFFRRQATTADYQDNSSAMQRLESWQAGMRLMRDHPFGAGGRGFHLLSGRYIPDIVASHSGANRAPHNTYVMIGSEWGIPGLLLYFGFIASTFLMLNRVRRAALARNDSFFYYRSIAVFVAIVATMVAGTFTDRLYGEAIYWMCALAAVLYRLQCSELAEAEETESAMATEAISSGALAPAPAMLRRA